MNMKQFFVFFLIGLGILFLVYLAFNGHVRKSLSKQISLSEWKALRDKYRSEILASNSFKGESRWNELRRKVWLVDSHDKQFRDAWVDFQVELVDKTVHDPTRTDHHELWIQEMTHYPGSSMRYEEWVRKRLQDPIFSSSLIMGKPLIREKLQYPLKQITFSKSHIPPTTRPETHPIGH